MKKFKNILLIGLVAFATLSCKDSYEIIQDGELPEATSFNSTNDLELYLVGAVYGSVDISNEIKFASVFTDEVKVGTSNSGFDYGLHRYILNPSDGYVGGIWLTHYGTINRVNRLLKAAEGITPTSTSDQQAYNSILAEARAIRAFAYLQLESHFTTDMANNNALGVILSTSVPDIQDQLPRSTNGVIWGQIESDLNFADTNLNSSYQVSVQHSFPFFVSKTFINAMRARMYLYRKNYTLAKQYAQAAITSSGVSLTLGTPIPSGTIGSTAWNNTFYNETDTPNPYRRMWADVNNGEILFSLSRPIGGTGGNIASLYTTNTTAANGSPLWSFGINLFNALNSNTNDIRRYAFIDPTSTASTNNYIIDKYPGKGNTPLRNNIKVFRLSEMYFILAECAVQQNDLAGAAGYIQAVRSARKYSGSAVLPTYTNKVVALQDILKERRVELCFEGHRYVDLRRLGAEANVSINRNAADDLISSTPLTLPITDYRWTLPIPISEILGNPSIQQNPQY